MKGKAQWLAVLLIGVVVGGAWPLIFQATEPQTRYNENIDLRPTDKPAIFAPLPEEVPEVKPNTPTPKPNEAQPAIPAVTPAQSQPKQVPVKVPVTFQPKPTRSPTGRWTWVPIRPSCPTGNCRPRGLFGL